MLNNLADIKQQSLVELEAAQTIEELEGLRLKYLGKKGLLTQVLRGMSNLPPEIRPQVGQEANRLRSCLNDVLVQKLKKLKDETRQKALQLETIDVTLPGQNPLLGHKHPVTQILDEMIAIFLGMGYEVVEGPEVQLDYYNFEALNIPKDHPARDMQDSFYITGDMLLRTHTSPVQVRTMEKTAPRLPIRIIVPGKVYRRDDDATHSPMFHQVEGLLVDRQVTLSDLKGTLMSFSRQMFGQNVQVRLRPSYFPFTEPSAEVDISCIMCAGKGCRVCSQTGWLEILGSGMVHPRVLKMGGYNPEEVSGFAFGMGVERIAMLKYGIDDMRLLFDNDLRFLRQFA